MSQQGLVLPDVWPENASVIFCGTAPGFESARQHHYYAHPGNLFWRALSESGLTPQLLKPEEYPRIQEWGMGLTDLAKHDFGNDEDLPPEAFDTEILIQKILDRPPRILAFTSKTAARAFFGLKIHPPLGLMPEPFGPTRMFVLPSPSGRARRFWTLAPWKALALLKKDLEAPARRPWAQCQEA